MGHTGPSRVVSAPLAATPEFGLRISAMKPPADELAEGHWRNGIQYEPEGCQKGQTLDPCFPAATIYPTHPSIVEWDPYGLQVTEKCSTFSYREERIARINRLMEMDTERQLGHEFWTGQLTQLHNAAHPEKPWPNTWLSNPADLTELNVGGALSPEDALACLEFYLAHNNGGQTGMIHATAHTAVHWFKTYLVMKDPATGLLKTPLGTIVVVSPGYTGTNPEGVTGPGDVFAYATDMVRVWLGPTTVPNLEDVIDRSQNTVQTQADRIGLAEFQRCRHAGVQIDLTPCESEGS